MRLRISGGSRRKGAFVALAAELANVSKFSFMRKGCTYIASFCAVSFLLLILLTSLDGLCAFFVMVSSLSIKPGGSWL